MRYGVEVDTYPEDLSWDPVSWQPDKFSFVLFVEFAVCMMMKARLVCGVSRVRWSGRLLAAHARQVLCTHTHN